MRDSRPHVLAFPLPAQGHLNPMMVLCHRLASSGFVITFLNTRSISDSSKHLQGEENFRFMSIADDCLQKLRLGNNLQLFLDTMEAGMRVEFESIVEQLMNDPSWPPVSCILCDSFLGWPREVATKFGIHRASLWTSNATWALICLHFPLLQSRGLLPFRGSDQVIDFLPGVPAFSAKHFPATIQVEDEDDPGFHKRVRRNDLMRNDLCVFVNSFLELESEQTEELKKEVPGLLPIGPLLPLDFFEDYTKSSSKSTRFSMEEDLSCLEWLDKQEKHSVVYVSFGSLATLAEDEAEEVLEGLRRSGYAFLWVMRKDLLEKQSDDFLSKIRQGEKCLFISWAPQLKVLRHESVGAFLTHCGWNSTTETIAAGVPMLCMPRFAEQRLNSALIVDHFKLGLRAVEEINGTPQQVNSSWIESVVRSIMGEEVGTELRIRAKALSDAARRSAGQSTKSLQAFKNTCTK